MATERFFYRRRRHGAPIFPTLTFPDHDLVAGEINVLDAQVQAFGQPQSGAVQKHHHDPVAAVKLGKQRLHLLSGQYNRESAWALRPHHVVEPAQLASQYFTIEKEQPI